MSGRRSLPSARALLRILGSASNEQEGASSSLSTFTFTPAAATLIRHCATLPSTLTTPYDHSDSASSPSSPLAHIRQPPSKPPSSVHVPQKVSATTTESMAVRLAQELTDTVSPKYSLNMQQPPSQPRAYSQAFQQPNGLPASGPVPGARPLDPNQGRVQQIGHARVLCVADVRGMKR